MLHHKFSSLSRHSQAFILACVAAWDDETKCSELLLKYVGTPVHYKLYRKPTDTFFVAQFEKLNLIGCDGTKNKLEWLVNFKGLPFGRPFHPGFDDQVKSTMQDIIEYIVNKETPVILGGQSNGEPEALLRNYYLRDAGFSSVESFGFNGPYCTTDEGYDLMGGAMICHTHWESDPWSTIPSDPTNLTGVLGGKHYGLTRKVFGSGSLFDHSYLNIMLKLLATFLAWSKDKHRYYIDAAFWADLYYNGNGRDLIKC